MTRRQLFAAVFVVAAGLLGSISPALAEGTFVPARERADMEHDPLRNILYITNGDTLLRFDMTTESFLDPILLGGSLKGIDISPDGNTLLVADRMRTGGPFFSIHKVDLVTESHEKIIFPGIDSAEGGTWSVAFGNDGKALVTTVGNGHLPLRMLDPETGASTIIPSDIGVGGMVSANGPGTVIAIATGSTSPADLALYDVATQTMRRAPRIVDGATEISVRRDGKQLTASSKVFDGQFNELATLGQRNISGPVGTVYSPIQDILFTSWAYSTEVRAYDAHSLKMIARYDFEYLFEPQGRPYQEGRLKMSRNGAWLFCTVGGGVRYVKIGEPGVGFPFINALSTHSGTGAEAVDLTLLIDGDTRGWQFGAITPTDLFFPVKLIQQQPVDGGMYRIGFRAKDGSGDIMGIDDHRVTVTGGDPQLDGTYRMIQLTLDVDNDGQPELEAILLVNDLHDGISLVHQPPQ